MPHFDAYLFNKKGIRKPLTLILEEGEGILESVKAGMQQHNLSEVTVEGAEGRVFDTLINFFERGNFKSTVLKDNNVMMASGNFKLSYGELFGSMKIITSDKPPIHGTVVRGKAHDGFTLKFSFLEMVDK